jgi:hypothetical protein
MEVRKTPKHKKYMKNYHAAIKHKAKWMVGRGILKCVNCGCDDERILEINHKNGGGSKERKKYTNINRYYSDIINGNRSVLDLDIMCRVCNALHYIKLKYGIMEHLVVWK